MSILARLSIVGLIALAGLSLRCANYLDALLVFGPSFADGDCYARLSRVAQVSANPGIVLRTHDFENYPVGTVPHTTVPLDYLLALPDWILPSALTPPLSELLSTLFGPLCFVVVLLALIRWLHLLGWPRGWWAGPALFALSPIAVQGTMLCRPDHQALLLALLGFALVADGAMIQTDSRLAAGFGGCCWGFALWTSLYEPAMLFLLTRAFLLTKNWRLTARSGIGTGFVLLLALWIEGWRIDLGWLNGEQAALFARWSRRIGELASQPPWSWTMLGWFGGFLLLLPLTVWRGPRALGVGLLILLGLTCWQARWGYFLVLAIALALPLVWSPVRGAPQIFLALALVPVGIAALQHAQRPAPNYREIVALNRIARTIQPDNLPGQSILAPWWLCPSLAYWSKHPAIAGSSHQSIPGAIDAERVLASTNDAEAFNIIRRRRVRWIVLDSEQRLVEGALQPERYGPDSLAMRARHHPDRLPAFLEIVPRAVGSVDDSPYLLLVVRFEYLAP